MPTSPPRSRLGDGEIAELAERVPDVLYRYRVRPAPRFDYVSAAATRVTGRTPAEHHDDPMLWFRIVHPDDRELLVRLLTGPTDGEVVRLRVLRHDGPAWLEHRAVGVFDEGGNLIAVEGVAREVRDRISQPAPLLATGDVVVDLASGRVRVDGGEVTLTPSELRLLVLLAERAGADVSRTEIMRHLWRSDFVGNERSCEVHVSNLRKKIERDPRRPTRIVTVRGRGYRLVAG